MKLTTLAFALLPAVHGFNVHFYLGESCHGQALGAHNGRRLNNMCYETQVNAKSAVIVRDIVDGSDQRTSPLPDFLLPTPEPTVPDCWLELEVCNANKLDTLQTCHSSRDRRARVRSWPVQPAVASPLRTRGLTASLILCGVDGDYRGGGLGMGDDIRFVHIPVNIKGERTYLARRFGGAQSLLLQLEA